MDDVPADADLPESARRLFGVFADAGREIYLVGGYVRDLLLGVPSVDLDMATSATPDETVEILERSGIKAVPLGMDFGTVGAVMGSGGDGMVEITTFRVSEAYPPGDRHPVVRFGGSIREDLVRRDFTVNAMAMGRDGEIVDPTGGREDLRRRLLRTPGDPVLVMREDPLRMLRALRFMAQLDFRLQDDVTASIARCSGEISNVSAERCKRELDRLMEVSDGGLVAGAFMEMAGLGLLGAMVPELRPLLDSEDVDQGVHHHLDPWKHSLAALAVTKPDICLRWATLLHDAGKPAARRETGGGIRFIGHEKGSEEIALQVAQRLRFTRRQRRCVAWLVRNHMRPLGYSRQWTDRAVRRLARDAGENLESLLQLAAADAAAHHPAETESGLERVEALRERLEGLSVQSGRRLLLPAVGSVLAEMLPAEGRKIGMMLEALETEVAAGRLEPLAPVDVCLQRLRELDLLD